MWHKDIIFIVLTALSGTLWLHNGYSLGLSHNPKIQLKQLLQAIPKYKNGFKNSGYNFFSCDVKDINKQKGEVLLYKCEFKYIDDKDTTILRNLIPCER